MWIRSLISKWYLWMSPRFNQKRCSFSLPFTDTYYWWSRWVILRTNWWGIWNNIVNQRSINYTCQCNNYLKNERSCQLIRRTNGVDNSRQHVKWRNEIILFIGWKWQRKIRVTIWYLWNNDNELNNNILSVKGKSRMAD